MFNYEEDRFRSDGQSDRGYEVANDNVTPSFNTTQYIEEDRFRSDGQSDRGYEGGQDNIYTGSYANPVIGHKKNGEVIYENDQIKKINKDRIVRKILEGWQKPQELEKELEVLWNNPDKINYILDNQAMMTLDSSYKDSRRSEQFFRTLAILKEHNFDFSQLTFERNGKQMDFLTFMCKYASEAYNKAVPLSYKLNTKVLGNPALTDNPVSMARSFIKEEYEKNPQRFKDEYQEYIAEKAKRNDDTILSYRDFIIGRYGFDMLSEIRSVSPEEIEAYSKVNEADKETLLKLFEENRKKQLAEDSVNRTNEVNKAIANKMQQQYNIFESQSMEDSLNGRANK